MTLKETINKDFMEAFKADNKVKKNFLGLLKGEIQTEEGRGNIATDIAVMAIIKKMEKSLKQTNTEESLSELKFIEPYLPSLMSEEEVSKAISDIISGGANNIGLIMKSFNESYTGKADNAMVSKLAKQLLG